MTLFWDRKKESLKKAWLCTPVYMRDARDTAILQWLLKSSLPKLGTLALETLIDVPNFSRPSAVC